MTTDGNSRLPLLLKKSHLPFVIFNVLLVLGFVAYLAVVVLKGPNNGFHLCNLSNIIFSAIKMLSFSDLCVFCYL